MTGENTQAKLLALIGTDPFISLQELSNKIGLSRAGIAWQIKKLKKNSALRELARTKEDPGRSSNNPSPLLLTREDQEINEDRKGQDGPRIN